MVQQCCVCKRYFTVGENIQFHSFPTDANRKKEWLSLLGLSEHKNHFRVCSDHFLVDDYTAAVVSGRPRLKTKAKPSLKLEKHVGSSGTDTHDQVSVLQENNNYTSDSGNEVSHMAIKVENHDNESEYSVPNARIHLSSEKHDKSSETSCIIEFDNEAKYNENSLKSDIQTEVDIKPCEHSIECYTNNSKSVNLVGEKRKSANDDVWAEFGDEDFLKYKRLKDVNWEKVVDDKRKATICWEVAMDEIAELKKELRIMKAKQTALMYKVKNLQGLTETLTRNKYLTKSTSNQVKNLPNTAKIKHRKKDEVQVKVEVDMYHNQYSEISREKLINSAHNSVGNCCEANESNSEVVKISQTDLDKADAVNVKTELDKNIKHEIGSFEEGPEAEIFEQRIENINKVINETKSVPMTFFQRHIENEGELEFDVEIAENVKIEFDSGQESENI